MARTVHLYSPRFTSETWVSAQIGNELDRYFRSLPDVSVRSAKGFLSTSQAGFLLLESMSRDPRRLVVYIGHGEPDRLVGNQALSDFVDPLLILPDEAMVAGIHDGIFDNAIVVVIACYTGRELADAAIDAGASAWIGAPDAIMLAINQDEMTYGDYINRSFEKIPIALAKGATTGEALRIFRDYQDQLIIQFSDPDLQFGQFYSDIVRNNKEQMRIYGNPDVRWTG